jgi:formate hydrogenlyase subunit 6/NADH:ubiquinone oxidoreductase subunit I
MGNELNVRFAYTPRVRAGKEKYCIFCKRCEYACPVWAIYIVDEQEQEESAKDEAEAQAELAGD